MGKRTKTTIIRENPDELDERHEPPGKVIDEDIGEQSYSTFVGRFQGSQGCRVKVYRITPRGRQYCFSGTPEEIESEETIRRYHADQTYAHEEGNYVLYVTVNGELRDPFTINIAPQLKTPGGPSGGMAVAVSPEVQMLREQLNRLESRLTQQDRPPILDLVDGMAKIDAMRNNNGGSGGGLNLDVVTRCIEIGTRMAGGGPQGDGGWEGMVRDVVKENAPALIGLFQMIARKVGAEQPATQIPPEQQPPAQPNPPAVEETMKPEEQERAIMQQALIFLKKKAAAHSDPGLYVDLIVDNREDPLYARLISEIVDNDFPAFAAIDPDIEKPEYREFFSFIHDRIRRLFKPKDTVATVGGGQDGNAKNTPSNGATGKSGGK